MTWTYSGDPASSNKDKVRFLVGDTKSDAPLATDEEITWAITEEINIYGAAALIAEGISSFFATQADLVKIGPIWEQYSKRSTDYAAKAKTLRNKASSKSEFTIFAGGIDVVDKLSNELDTSLVQPNFAIGMTDREDI